MTPLSKYLKGFKRPPQRLESRATCFSDHHIPIFPSGPCERLKVASERRREEHHRKLLDSCWQPTKDRRFHQSFTQAPRRQEDSQRFARSFRSVILTPSPWADWLVFDSAEHGEGMSFVLCRCLPGCLHSLFLITSPPVPVGGSC